MRVSVCLRGAPRRLVSDLWVLAWPEGMYLAPWVRVISPQHRVTRLVLSAQNVSSFWSSERLLSLRPS